MTERSFVVHNSGDEPLDWTGETEAGWISMSPTFGRVSPHTNATVTVKVFRSGLTAGSYQTNVHFESNGGTKTAGVMAKIPATGVVPDPVPDPDPTPNPDPTPDPPPSSARISVTPTSLDFGEFATELVVLVHNPGSSTLDWTAEPSNAWLSLPASGSLPAGQAHGVTVRASRSRLTAAGQYHSSIQFRSNGGNKSVPVTLEVAPPPPPPPDGGSGLSGIDATGTWDVTDQLNEYLAGVPHGSVVTLPAGARYRAEGVVRIIGKTNFTIEGNGALIFAETDGNGVTPPEDLKHLWPRQRSHLEIYGGSNIVIRDLMVRGANPNAGADEGAFVVTLEGQHGFDVRGVNGLLLDGVTATDTYGDLLYISGVPALGGWSRNIKVTNSHFERSGRQGIAITGAENVQILDSYIGEIGRTIIDLEPATAGGGAQNILFEGNTFGPCRHLLMNSGGNGPNVDGISFIGNQLVGMGLKIRVRAADGSRRENYRILDNVSDRPLGLPVAAIRFAWVDGIEVRGNYQVMNEDRSMTAVSTCESTEIIVRDNDFPGAVNEHVAESFCPDFE